MKECKCAQPNPWESNSGKKTNVCKTCQGKIPDLEKVQLVDAEFWLQAHIYRPKERVRAIHKDGKYYVYDGVEVYEFTEDEFKATYELAAQSCVQRKIDKKTTVYEYH